MASAQEVAPKCSWDDVGRELFQSSEAGARTQRCVIKGEIAGRVLDSTHIVIAFREDTSPKPRVMLAELEITPEAVPDARWNWRTSNGTVVVANRELYVEKPTADVPALAFGRFADALAARYPDAFRLGIRAEVAFRCSAVAMTLYATLLNALLTVSKS
jgi:hypothetical protein